MKRVLFIVNRMNYRPSSGHGTFMKGVVETVQKHGHQIDIVCDGEPEANFLEDTGIVLFTPPKQERLGYSKHTTLFQFGDSFNFEKAINYRTALTTALSTNTYDLIICNDLEAAFVCYQMDLHQHINVTSFTHECASINPELGAGVFRKCYYDFVDKMMTWPEITTLVQTDKNLEKLKTIHPQPNDLNCQVQNYPLCDSQVVEGLERNGLLFIGRHEDRKGPKEFIKVLQKIREKYGVEVRANIMTRSAHVKKFEADFAAIGHTNYEIVADVVGEAKARIIQKSQVAFLPYKNESYGIAVIEAMRFMPTVVLDCYDWHYNFEGFWNYIVASKDAVADIVWDNMQTYQHDEAARKAEFDAYDKNYENQILDIVNMPNTRQKKSEPSNRLYKYLKENQGEWVSISEYFKTQNEKGYIYLSSDIETLYTIQPWVQINQTREVTYYGIPSSTSELTMPKPKEAALSKFFTK